MSQIDHIKLNIEKLKRDVSHGRVSFPSGACQYYHSVVIYLSLSLSICNMRKGASTLLGMNSQPFLYYFSLIYYILSFFSAHFVFSVFFFFFFFALPFGLPTPLGQ